MHPHSGYEDISVLKLDSAGAYGWHTFYGSSEEDIGWAIAVDGSGGVYVTGGSVVTWQGDGGAEPLHAYSGYWDFAVLKLNDNVYGVMLTPSSDAASSDPGSDVVYTLTATNTGTTTDTFDVSLDGNDWPTTAPLTIGPLGSGMSATLGITVSVPFTVGCGDVDTVIVTATSQHNAWASDSSTLTTTANTLYGLRVEPSTAALGGDPGSDLAYTLTVTNSGNCTDTFDLSLGGNDWPTVAPLTIGPLGSGVSATLGVTVSVPLGTRGGISDTVILTCTSQNDDTASDSSTLTTTANQVAPVLDPIGAQMVVMGHILTFTATAGDANADTLTFSLDAGAPEGAILDPVTGEFTWTPDTAGVYTATVRVTDDGVLPLDDFKAVIITVETEMLYVYLPLVVKNR